MQSLVPIDPGSSEGFTWQVESERLRLVFRLIPAAILGNGIVLALISLLLPRTAQEPLFAPWMVAMLLLLALRIAGALVYVRRAPRPGPQTRGYLRFHVSTYVLMGLGWGLLAAVVSREQGNENFYAIATCYALAGGSIAFAGYFRWAYVSYLIAILAPVGASLAVAGVMGNNRIEVVLGGATIFFIIFLFGAARQFSQSLLDSVTALVQHADTAARLQREVAVRVAAEQRLQRLLSEQRAILASMPSGVAFIGAGAIRTVNPPLAQMFRSEPDKMVGEPAQLLFAGQEAWEQALREMGVANGVYQAQGEFRRSDGSRLIALIQAAALDSREPQQGAVVTLTDITRRRESEQALESFSYTVAHDLRSPLRAIDGWSAILLLDHAAQLDPDGARLLGRVRTEAQRMGLMIGALLELARVSHQALAPVRVDLSAMAAELMARTAERFPAAGRSTDIAPGVFAHGDPLLLHFALQNLIENAFKFSAQTAAPHVEFGVAGEAAAPVYFVRDNGVGFAAEDAQQVFQPFRRLDTALQFSGTGVGLASVAQVIERHGGRIWAESAPGQGATFHFTLPSCAEADPR